MDIPLGRFKIKVLEEEVTRKVLHEEDIWVQLNGPTPAMLTIDMRKRHKVEKGETLPTD